MTAIPLLAQIQNVAGEDLIGSERWTGGGAGGLIAVTLVLFLGLGAVAWYFNRRGGPLGRKLPQNLEVLETRSLGGRQFLLVAAYGEERFLLSVCPGRIEFLCPLPRIENDGSGGEAETMDRSSRATFKDVLNKLSAAREKKGKQWDD